VENFPKRLPKEILVGDITYQRGEITKEEIEKGKDLIYSLLKKDLPEYKILEGKPASADFLELRVEFDYIIPFSPRTSPLLMSAIGEGRIILVYQGEKILEIKHNNKELACGGIYGRQGAFYQFLSLGTKSLIKELRR
jgi:hypothetical protein